MPRPSDPDEPADEPDFFGGLEDMMADLEQLADGMHLRDRDDEVAALQVAEYARIDLESRLHASVGWAITAHVAGGMAIRGRLEQVGPDCCVMLDDTSTWLVALHRCRCFVGLSPRSVATNARAITAGLGPRTQLREFAEAGRPCQVYFQESSITGVVGRVGRDFMELHRSAGAEPLIVPWSAVVAVRMNERG